MLGLMQQLSFEAAQVRFEDASITKRALDYAGSQQNISGQQMADSLKAMTPIMAIAPKGSSERRCLETACSAGSLESRAVTCSRNSIIASKDTS